MHKISRKHPSIFPFSAAVILMVSFTGKFWWGPYKLSKMKEFAGYMCILLVPFCLCYVWVTKECRWVYYLSALSCSNHHWQDYLFACCLLHTTNWAPLSAQSVVSSCSNSWPSIPQLGTCSSEICLCSTLVPIPFSGIHTFPYFAFLGEQAERER